MCTPAPSLIDAGNNFPLTSCTTRLLHAVRSLSRLEAYPFLVLLRTLFAGFLDEVELKDQTEDLADFLTSEGVLLKPDPAKANYRMASALVDGFLRTRLIPLTF